MAVSAFGILILMYLITALLLEWKWRDNLGRDEDRTVANSVQALKAAARIEPDEGEEPEEDVVVHDSTKFLKPLSYHSPAAIPERPSFYPSTKVVDTVGSVVIKILPNESTAPSFFRVPFEVDGRAVMPTLDINSTLMQLPASKCKYSCGKSHSDRKKNLRQYRQIDIGAYACRKNDDGSMRALTNMAADKAASSTSFVCTAPETSAAARVVKLANKEFAFPPADYSFEVVTKHWQQRCAHPLLTYPATLGVGDEAPFLKAMYGAIKSSTFALYIPAITDKMEAEKMLNENIFLILKPDKKHLAKITYKARVPWTPHTAHAHIRTIPLTRIFRSGILSDDLSVRHSPKLLDFELDVHFKLSTTSRYAVTYDARDPVLVGVFALRDSETADMEFEFDSATTRVRKRLRADQIIASDQNMLGIGFMESLITVIDDEQQIITFASISS